MIKMSLKKTVIHVLIAIKGAVICTGNCSSKHFLHKRLTTKERLSITKIQTTDCAKGREEKNPVSTRKQIHN